MPGVLKGNVSIRLLDTDRLLQGQVVDAAGRVLMVRLHEALPASIPVSVCVDDDMYLCEVESDAGEGDTVLVRLQIEQIVRGSVIAAFSANGFSRVSDSPSSPRNSH